MQNYRSSHSNSSNRVLQNYQEMPIANAGFKNPDEQRMRAKLLKYKAKVAHYQIILEQFFMFVQQKINSNSTRRRVRYDGPMQPEFQLCRQPWIKMERQLQLEINRLSHEKNNLQSRYEELQQQFQSHRRKFKINMSNLQRQNQVINSQLGKAQRQINACQYSDLEDFTLAKLQYLQTVRLSEEKMDQVEGLYRELMNKEVSQIKEKEAIKEKLLRTKNKLQDKVELRDKIIAESHEKMSSEKSVKKSKAKEQDRARSPVKSKKMQKQSYPTKWERDIKRNRDGNNNCNQQRPDLFFPQSYKGCAENNTIIKNSTSFRPKYICQTKGLKRMIQKDLKAITKEKKKKLIKERHHRTQKNSIPPKEKRKKLPSKGNSFHFDESVRQMNSMKQSYLREKHKLKYADEMVNELESMYKTLLSTEHSKEAKELCAALSKMKNVNKKLEQQIDEKRKIINWKQNEDSQIAPQKAQNKSKSKKGGDHFFHKKYSAELRLLADGTC